MKKILLILLILVCIFSLCSLTLGYTVDGLFTGVNNTSSADDYGQFMESFETILSWFDGIGDFIEASLGFIRGVGIAVAEAWEAVEVKVAEIGTAIVETFENILEFFGWVNTEKPPETPEIPENSALRCCTDVVAATSQRAERILKYVA